MTWKQNETTRAILVESVKSGNLTLAQAQRMASEQVPLQAVQDYHGFAGMTADEMCGGE